MPSFCLIFWGSFLFYSGSKYFPHFFTRPSRSVCTWLGAVFLAAGTAIFVKSDGWASGLLLSLVAYPLALGLLQLFSVLGRNYFYGLLVVVHFLLLIDLISYAS
jgi:hypothetical protein